MLLAIRKYLVVCLRNKHVAVAFVLTATIIPMVIATSELLPAESYTPETRALAMKQLPIL